MIEIMLANNEGVAIVDDEFSHLVGYRWRLDKQGYVYRKVKGRRRYLHHAVLPGDRYPAYVRDHISCEKMDNRKANLRWLTMAESAQNKAPYRRNKTGFRGVMPQYGRFRATARLDGKVYRFGLYDTAEEAHAVVTAWRRENMPFASV